jgi:DNA-binding IclR family transcriptional regulator
MGQTEPPAELPGESGGRYRNETLERTFRILETLNEAERGLSVAEVARRAGLHRATVHRFLTNLAEMGYVRRDPERGTYWIGFNLARFGLKSRIIGRIVHAARPALRRLSGETGCIVALGSLEGSQILLCELIVPPDAPEFRQAAGDYVNAAASAMGRALLALRTDAELLRRVRINPRSAPGAAVAAESLLREIREVRRRGVAVAEEEAGQAGFRSLAAPLLNPAGRATCALAVIGSSWQVPAARDLALGNRVLAAARDIVAALTPGLPVPEAPPISPEAPARRDRAPARAAAAPSPAPASAA